LLLYYCAGSRRRWKLAGLDAGGKQEENRLRMPSTPFAENYVFGKLVFAKTP